MTSEHERRPAQDDHSTSVSSKGAKEQHLPCIPPLEIAYDYSSDEERDLAENELIPLSPTLTSGLCSFVETETVAHDSNLTDGNANAADATSSYEGDAERS